jgi:hypothetical protein
MKRLIILFVGVIMGVSFCSKVTAQEEVIKAKAKFIYNFTRYVEWPSDANSNNFIISVFGSSQLVDELKDYTSNKLVGKRTIIIQKVSNAAEIDNCQILFVGYTKTKELKDIKSKLKNKNTLIVSEKDGALDDGSIINFIIDNEKLSYEIKPNNAESVGLKLNSTIISYAKHKS